MNENPIMPGGVGGGGGPGQWVQLIPAHSTSERLLSAILDELREIKRLLQKI